MTKTRISLAISILILATLACNALLPTAEPTPVVIFEPTNPSQPSDLPVTEADVPRAPLEVAYTAYTAGAAIIVDVRSRSAYAELHVPNALSIPLDMFEINIEDVNLDKEQWIITYCT
ncbi:MAG: rhodanese-like domain-containing protein [Anaerolineales bacterium]|nr:rhodanese-like domain-containing protein [Anaerolineales bacterium]